MNAHALRSVVGLATAATCLLASAQDADPGTVAWRCWWDGAIHVTCVPAQARPASPPRWMHIPLYDYPFDTEGMSVLAQSVMCGREAACRVEFSKDVPTAAELQAWAGSVLARVE